jgi:DOPA 4,5-dioxygenase
VKTYPKNLYQHYHAHIYYDANTLNIAQHICLEVADRFKLKIGRLHQTEVGPHPRWSCQISFNHQHFDRLIAWLDAQRQGLTILVHGQTGDDLKDHTEHAYWLGEAVPLNLAMFK